MGILSGLFKLTNLQRLPRLRHHYTNGRQMDEKDEGVQILLDAGIMRDWTQAKKLVKKRGQSAEVLYWSVSRAAVPNWRKRLLNRVIRAFGAFPHDPYRAEIKRLEKGDFNANYVNRNTYQILPGARNRQSKNGGSK